MRNTLVEDPPTKRAGGCRGYLGMFEDGTRAEISSDTRNNCLLSEALRRLVQRHVTHKEAKDEHDRLMNYALYAYDDPLNDPSLSEPLRAKG